MLIDQRAHWQQAGWAGAETTGYPQQQGGEYSSWSGADGAGPGAGGQSEQVWVEWGEGSEGDGGLHRGFIWLRIQQQGSLWHRSPRGYRRQATGWWAPERSCGRRTGSGPARPCWNSWNRWPPGASPLVPSQDRGQPGPHLCSSRDVHAAGFQPCRLAPPRSCPCCPSRSPPSPPILASLLPSAAAAQSTGSASWGGPLEVGRCPQALTTIPSCLPRSEKWQYLLGTVRFLGRWSWGWQTCGNCWYSVGPGDRSASVWGVEEVRWAEEGVELWWVATKASANGELWDWDVPSHGPDIDDFASASHWM